MRLINVKRIVAVSSIVIYSMCSFFCLEAFAQGPINNAIQFQEKAVQSALKNPKRQNYGPKRDSMELFDRSKPDDDDTAGEDDDSQPIDMPINIK